MISVITPNYNGESWLEPCLDSVANQTLSQENIEMIVVDDGSTDQSRDIINRYEDYIPGLQLVSHDHIGMPGVLRNIGIERASGEYVLFLDSDDYLGKESLQRLQQFGGQTKSDVIAFQLEGEGRSVPRSMLRETIVDVNLVKSGLYKTLGTWKMCRRDFLIENGIKFGNLGRGEDVLFFTEAMLRAASISVLSGYPFYTVRGREDGTSITQGEWVPTERIELARKMASIVVELARSNSIRNHFLIRPFNTDALAILNSDITSEQDKELLRDSLQEYWSDGVRQLIYTEDARRVLTDFFGVNDE